VDPNHVSGPCQLARSNLKIPLLTFYEAQLMDQNVGLSLTAIQDSEISQNYQNAQTKLQHQKSFVL